MGPTRLHVGFGNGEGDATRVVWGAGGLARNAPAWLNEAAWRGWSGDPGAPVPAPASPDAPAGPGPAPAPDANAAPVDDVDGRLDSVAGGILRWSDKPGGLFGWLTRGAIALYQLCARRPATGLPDVTSGQGLVRYGTYLRAAGWLLAVIGVVGLVKSLGGSSADDYVHGLDRFRDMLGASADPSVNQVFEIVKQILEAARPALASAAGSGPFAAVMAAAGRFVPDGADSTAALVLGVALHQIGARIVQGRI